MNQRELEMATDGEIILYLMQNKDISIRLNAPHIDTNADEAWDYWQFTWSNCSYTDHETGDVRRTEAFIVEKRSGLATWSGRGDMDYDDYSISHYTHLEAEQAIIKLRQAMEDGYKPSFTRFEIPI